MILSRLTPANKFDIWTPKYSTGVVKLADYKIGTHNEVKFVKTKDINSYYVSGSKAKSFPLIPMKTKAGGTLMMREVPINELETLERE